jgi:hypothetical protein
MDDHISDVEAGNIRGGWFLTIPAIGERMEKKECTSIIGLAAAIISFSGLVGCGIVCIALHQALEIQRQYLSEARAQTLALDQALKTQQHDLLETRSELASAANRIAEAQKQNQALGQQMTEIQTKLSEGQSAAQRRLARNIFPAPMPDFPAGDSIEGQLQADGKRWERIEAQPVVGGYVQDILIGRAGQPKGRGNVGKVVSLGVSDTGRPGATVDFGRGCTEGIMLSELSTLRIIEPEMR